MKVPLEGCEFKATKRIGGKKCGASAVAPIERRWLYVAWRAD